MTSRSIPSPALLPGIDERCLSYHDLRFLIPLPDPMAEQLAAFVCTIDSYTPDCRPLCRRCAWPSPPRNHLALAGGGCQIVTCEAVEIESAEKIL